MRYSTAKRYIVDKKFLQHFSKENFKANNRKTVNDNRVLDKNFKLEKLLQILSTYKNMYPPKTTFFCPKWALKKYYFSERLYTSSY